jgi:glycosyltransferase involved in cell wall biosynthesis
MILLPMGTAFFFIVMGLILLGIAWFWPGYGGALMALLSGWALYMLIDSNYSGGAKALYGSVLALFLGGDNHSLLPGLLNGDPRNVIWRQRLPEDEINAFYSSLSLFLYISAYEGFGLPPMEALNCGTPSLLLRRSSLAEIYDDLALFIDRPDPALIARAICGFLRQEEETRRQLLKNWENRKPYFSWKRAAEEHLREIRKLR